jgi:hypothetical protein
MKASFPRRIAAGNPGSVARFLTDAKIALRRLSGQAQVPAESVILEADGLVDVQAAR